VCELVDSERVSESKTTSSFELTNRNFSDSVTETKPSFHLLTATLFYSSKNALFIYFLFKALFQFCFFA